VIAMTVSVANLMIKDRGGLSETGAQVLAFIDGGSEWLAWAGQDKSSTYSFPDETTLVAQIQQGLHASPVTLLSGLAIQISPIKLMAFTIGDLRVLAKANAVTGDAAIQAQLHAILSAHGVLTQSDLAAAPAFLTNLGVASSALFQCLDLNATIALFELIGPQAQGNEAILADAAAFALQQSCTPEEFSDYYRAYMALTAKLNNASSSTDQRHQQALTAVQTLQPLIYSALDCPEVSGLVSPEQVTLAVNDWLRRGNRVGFSRVSEGVCRIIDSTTFTTETGTEAQQMANIYMTSAQTFLSANSPHACRISQDGRSGLLPIQSGNLYAELQLGTDDCITLRQFRRISPSVANS
jgi:hypothetical protein